MVRRGRYKYIYIHEYGVQLFDLETDPGEWQNLAGNGAREVEESLRTLILDKFDPEQLAAAAADSVRRRMSVKEALERNGVHWDFSPQFDATKQYVR